MDIKVGDFGLAALLVNSNDMGARRTTMCGTPNYLAPEILEKGGRGHNEKVDLWAIGIIAYTLAVGRAPFHAAKREDIYKKLQKREYEWPDVSKSTSEISNDLRDLVAQLLVHEDDRPNPDQIVSHPFFKMNFVPVMLDQSTKEKAPKWTNVRPPTAEAIQRGYTDSWYQICKEAGVGEINGKTFQVIGGRKVRLVAKDCEREIQQGRQPIVPLPDDVVYLPYPDRDNNWPYEEEKREELSDIREEDSSREGKQLLETTENSRKMQQAPRRPGTSSSETTSKENVAPARDSVQAPVETIKRAKSVRKASDDRRPAKKPASTEPTPATAPTTTTTTATYSRSRAAAPLAGTDALSRCTRPVSASIPAALPTPPPVSSSLQTIRSTDPTTVLSLVTTLRNNLASALSGKNSVRKTSAPRGTPPPKLPFVSKWVDYSKKHGVGYVLEDGSIGCIAKASISTSGRLQHPTTHVLVRNGYSYLSRVVGTDLSSLDTIPFSYYTSTTSGLQRITLSSDSDKERRKMLGVLWVKFARYMCQQLGDVSSPEPDDSESDGDKSSSDNVPTFVRFYQRLGTAGIWGFSDGSLQFNFPDHTKMVLSGDGSYCNFTVLALDATRHLQNTGELPLRFIRSREVLSASVTNFLYGRGREVESYRPVTEANMLREKLAYVVRVVDAWRAAGGLGAVGDDAKCRLRWDGPCLQGGLKEDWVTVGGVENA